MKVGVGKKDTANPLSFIQNNIFLFQLLDTLKITW